MIVQAACYCHGEYLPLEILDSDSKSPRQQPGPTATCSSPYSCDYHADKSGCNGTPPFDLSASDGKDGLCSETGSSIHHLSSSQTSRGPQSGDEPSIPSSLCLRYRTKIRRNISIQTIASGPNQSIKHEEGFISYIKALF
jgi:hypothetical protein